MSPKKTIIPDTFEDAKWHKSPSGYFLIDDKEVACTIQCCHCGGHFVFRKGSGTTRGLCRNCMDNKRRLFMTCGTPKCDECIHYVKKIDLFERGKLAILR